MGVDTKAILAAHLTAPQLCAFVEAAAPGRRVVARRMNRPEHIVVEVGDADDGMAFDAFLMSWAADDYSDVFEGDSTLIVMNFSPAGVALLKALTNLTGGFVMEAAGQPWTQIEPSFDPASMSKH